MFTIRMLAMYPKNVRGTLSPQHSALVNSTDINTLSTTRPIQISIACALLLVSYLHSTYLAFSSPPPVVFGSEILGTLGAQIAGNLFNLMLVLFLYLGNNWARFFYLALIAFSFILELIFELVITPIAQVGVPRNTLYWFNLFVSLFVVVLLILPSSNTWYRSKN